MNVDKMQTDIVENQSYMNQSYLEDMRNLLHWKNILEKLPEALDEYSLYKILGITYGIVTYYTKDDDSSNQVRSEIQKTFNVIAQRKDQSEKVEKSPTFEMLIPHESNPEQILTVSIENASLAPGCTLEKRWRRQYYFKTVCDSNIETKNLIEVKE